ncbi:MAG TPA: alginate lyase family protein [Pyrinomonadaceae bacterium]|nr:alginate lyase family protein [Pyrinomonadaceae bacterium]
MALARKLKRALRGEVKLTTATQEAVRRTLMTALTRRERKNLDKEKRLLLKSPFSRMSPAELLAHFQNKKQIRFSFDSAFDSVFDSTPSGDTLSGIEWRRDPLSNYLWPLDYHRDLQLQRSDGSDVRVVWELNRLGHLLRIQDADEFLNQLRSWHDQNPYGRGPNWSCAMEVALRAINILAAFERFRKSPQLNPESLIFLLTLLQLHGRFIGTNLEFSYIATSNHYLSDVTGLLWLEVMLPELEEAGDWHDLALPAMLREMDKQILADGADYESSTGYHRFVLELFLYSFMLCHERGRQIDPKYRHKLHQMLEYVKAYIRPDGLAPLIGDTDGGQVLPFHEHSADDHAYLLDHGAEILNAPEFKFPQEKSKAFPDAGIYIMRSSDCYLCFNASGAGIHGRGSHGHNDALSIEVSAGGRAFIVDPGTYVYTGNLEMRHAFRSTAYHSTVKIDNEEQNTTDVNMPFVIGNEAQPRVLEWESYENYDKVVAEHYGYRRLESPVTHRRTVTFDKRECSWLIDDEFFGDGEHEFEMWLHFADGLQLEVRGAEIEARDKKQDFGLVVRSLSLAEQPSLVNQHVSRNYGELIDSVSACWRINGKPGKLSWELFLNK